MLPHLNIVDLVKAGGYVGLVFITFAESGLFFGFFLPGDSLLFTAGFLASQGFLNIWILVPILVIAAISGDSVGFWTGKKFGAWLLRQKDSFFFHRHHLFTAQKFYEKHGGKTLVLARFMPAVRTFAPIVAGMAQMHYPTFLTYNVVGGSLWAAGMLLLGYFLGALIPNVDRYLLPIISVIIVLSVAPGVIHFYLDTRKSTSNKPA